MSAASAPAAAVRLFYSYAHEDEELRNELERHLKILERKQLIAPWHDRRITAGRDWNSEIDINLRDAELVLLLVSADFMASDYIVGKELTAAMAQHAAGRSAVAWVLLRPLDLQQDDSDVAPFLKLQGLPPDLKPVTSWPQRDEAWVVVARGLRATVAEIRAKRPPGPAAAPPPPPPSAVQTGPIAAGSRFEPRFETPASPADAVRARRLPRSTLTGLLHGPIRWCLRLLGLPALIRDLPAAPLPMEDDGLPPSPAGRPAPAARPRDAVFDDLLATVRAPLALAARERGLGAPDPAQLDRDATWLIDRAGDLPRVLWVDDRPQGNHHERAALARLQIEVVCATRTDEALALLRAAQPPFDLVISDWQRDGDGPEAGLALARAMHDEGRKLPLLYYHGEFDATRRAQRRQQALEAGALGEAVLPQELIESVVLALRGPLGDSAPG